ncbi:MAG: hypothetical protein ABL931_10820 [Usitatibacteraceae bacterium]
MKSFLRSPRAYSMAVYCFALFFAALPADAILPRRFAIGVTEFVNDITQRRVLLTEFAEIDAVEKGAAGPGWRRSGLVFGVDTEVSAFQSTQPTDVCRFYAPSVHSHFFTLDTAECALLKLPGSGWNYEGIAFRAVAASADSQCVPVHRLYNNRAAFGDTTHRYTPDPEVRDALIAKGWIYEKVAFCATSYFYKTETYQTATTKILPSAECENEALNLGACIGLNQTAPLSYLVPLWSQVPRPFEPYIVGQPRSGTRVPFYFTGVEGDIATSINSASLDEITQRSFVVYYPSLTSFPGIYVSSKDRTTPDFPFMSVNPLYQFVTTPPSPGEADKRVMPWRDGIARQIELSFALRVAYVRRADDASHAITHPTLELIDTKSRRNLYITIGGAQTLPLPTNEAEDYFAADVGSGKIIVSTSFRANPSFGERIRGESFFCAASSTAHACDAGDPNFAFRLRPSDIAFIIAKARKLDSSLSPNIGDYAIDNFSFNNEVYKNAEIGLSLSNYTLTIREQQF